MLNGISVVLELVAAMLGVNYLYGRRLRLGIYDAVFLTLEICIVESVNYLGMGGQIAVLGYLIILPYQMLKFRAGVRRILTGTMMLVCVVVVMQTLCLAPLTILNEFFSSESLVFGANLSVLAAIAALGVKGTLERLFGYVTRHERFMNVFLSCCAVASFYLIIIYKYGDYLRITDFLIFGVWTVLLCVIMMKWQKAKEEYAVKEKELEIQKVYDGYAGELLKSVLRKQHDFDNYIQAMLGQTQTAATLEELVEGQKAFVRDVKEDNHYNKLLAGGNTLMTGFLYTKFLNAEREGCRVTYEVAVKELACGVPTYELVRITGILFDNAVEAVREREEREVRLTLCETEEEVELCVSNPCEYVPQETLHGWLEEGRTTKGKERGIGLYNVVSLAEKYGFDLKVYNDEVFGENRIVFIVSIKK